MRVTVTGGNGFLGRYVVRALEYHGDEVFVADRDEFDLRTEYGCRGLIHTSDPDAVVHLAASVGGIGDNVERPGEFVYENAVMGAHLMEQARVSLHCQKFLTVGTACMYPADAPIPMVEADILNGPPAPETAAYAHAKRLLLAQGQAYREQYDFNAIMVIPSNLYGPGDTSSHVVPSVIRKVSQAQGDIVLWGSGSPTRDFLYVENAADGIVTALHYYDDPLPVNLGSGVETSIAEFVKLVADEYGFDGAIRWDPTRPDGTMRRRLDITRAQSRLSWQPWTALGPGLRRTIDWFEGVDHEDHAVRADARAS